MRRVILVAVLAGAGVVAAAPAAEAHTVTGVRPTNYLSRILYMRPPVRGITLRLLDLGRRVELRNRTTQDVIVLGYSGAPSHRVGPGTTVRWRDRRTRFEGQTTSRAKHVASAWTIELRHGTTPIVVGGLITYVPGPSPWPWVAATVVLVAVLTAVAWTRRWGRWLSFALAVLMASDAIHSFGTAAAAHDSVTTQLVRVLLAGLVTTIAWIIGIAAIPSLQRNHEGGLITAAAVGIVIAMFSGVTDAGVFGNSQVATIFPAVSARIAVALALGLGIGLVGAAIAVIARDPALRPTTVAPDGPSL
jgi:hypothetical protein